MELSMRSIKTNNWSADNFKRRHHLNELYTWAGELYNGTLFDSCQIDHNMDVHKDVHYALDTQLVMLNPYMKTANQSACTIVAKITV